MASLSSSRKGRANNIRTSDSELESEIRVTGSYRNLIHRLVGQGEDHNSFAVELESLSSGDPSILAKLDDTLSIEDDVMLPKGVIPVYAWKLFYRTSLLETGYCVHEADEPVLDVIRSRTASKIEINEALGYEAPVPPAPKLVEPVYRRIERTEGDTASRLGFKIEPGEQPIKLAAGYTCVAFNLPVAQIVGRIAVSLNFPPASGSYLELSLFNAGGDRRLYIEMTSPETQFDQIRLEAGDTLLAFRCVRGALTGEGSYRHPNSRVIDSLPTKPSLDDILGQESDNLGPEVRIGVPRFTFSAR